MTTILEQVIQPTTVVGDIRYYSGESLILLAAAFSDFGRDYDVDVTKKDGELRCLKISAAIEKLCAGELVVTPEVEKRVEKLLETTPELPMKTVQDFGEFTYYDPRVKSMNVFDPLSELIDLPDGIVSKFVAAHYSTMSKTYKKLIVKSEFIGEVNGRLNGLDVHYFDSQYISFRGQGAYSDGFYIHNFLDEENHLVAWKTGKAGIFQRDELYTIVGGSIKAHDSYPGQPKKTLLTRAKFFEHQTGFAI